MERIKKNFENFCVFCKTNVDIIPVPFVLGFYVTLVVGRWWNQFTEIPWPDSMAIYVSAFIIGSDEKSIMYRRTIMRYLNLCFVMTLTSISTKARKMFPDSKSLIDNGLLTEEEDEILNDYETRNCKYFVPALWASNLVYEASTENLTIGERGVEALIEEISRFRGSLGNIFLYDWVNPPLVYTQIATISVHAYFLIFVFAEQFTTQSKVDIYVPLFGILQFVFFMGWLKVAESLINPFGDDDDDFELDEIIHRNIKISYIIIDEMFSSYPELDKDMFWNSSQDIQIIKDYRGPKNDMFAGSLINLNTDDSYIGSKLSMFHSNYFTSITKINAPKHRDGLGSQ